MHLPGTSCNIDQCACNVRYLAHMFASVYKSCFMLCVCMHDSKYSSVLLLCCCCIQEDMCCKIGDGLAAIGPALALDTLVEVMIIGVGTYAHQPLQSVCFFGCVSLTASFVLFTTFFPAALALTMEMSRGSRQRLPESCPRFSLEHLTTSFLAEEEDRKSNPVTQSIKVVMSCGLGFVHVFNWIVRPMHHDLAGMAALFDTPAIVLQPATDRLPVLSTDNHSLPQLLGLTLDEVRLLVLPSPSKVVYACCRFFYLFLHVVLNLFFPLCQ